jgi:hypothetical protein
VAYFKRRKLGKTYVGRGEKRREPTTPETTRLQDRSRAALPLGSGPEPIAKGAPLQDGIQKTYKD